MAESYPKVGDSAFSRLVALMVSHRNAANLFMILVIFFGLYGIATLNRQFFPSLETNLVSVNIIWPGASAEDVDLNIAEPVQAAIRYIDGIEHFTVNSADSSMNAIMEFELDWDLAKATADVETAINQINTLPVDIERPIIRQLSFYEPVGSILLYGDYPEKALIEQGKKIRDGLLEAGLDSVTLIGVRDEEIWVETRVEQLRRYGLTPDDIARAIRASSLDMPGGLLRGDTERQVRSKGLVKTAPAIGAIEVLATPSGRRVLVSDVATVSETFDDDQPTAWVGEQRALQIIVNRAASTDSLEALDKLTAFVDTFQPELPQGLSLKVYSVWAEKIAQRINLMVKKRHRWFCSCLADFVFVSQLPRGNVGCHWYSCSDYAHARADGATEYEP